MARQAFEDAIAELDSVSEDSYKVLYQLLCFHMLFWQLRFVMSVSICVRSSSFVYFHSNNCSMIILVICALVKQFLVSRRMFVSKNGR